MFDASQHSASPSANPREVMLFDMVVQHAVDDDLALGCECANPLLQIERWSQEAQPALHAA